MTRVTTKKKINKKPTQGPPDNIQCNKVTSSDDECENGSSSSYATKVHHTGESRNNLGRKSISRELSNLALDSPLFGTSKSKRRSSAVGARRRGRSIANTGGSWTLRTRRRRWCRSVN